MTSDDRYGRFVQERHRPALARRTAASHAGFLLPALRPGQRLLDLGCGPASITAGLHEAVSPGGGAVGIDRRIDLRAGPGGVPVVRGDVRRLPIATATVDAVFVGAVLQHVPDPLAVLEEAWRVCRPGAVIGVADTDWGGELIAPEDPWLVRGREIHERLREGTSTTVGRRLRGLLHRAGFEDATVTSRGQGSGDAGSAAFAEFQAAMFEAPATIGLVVERDIASAADMAAVAAAWRRWGADPGATVARHWFEATARKPGTAEGPH